MKQLPQLIVCVSLVIAILVVTALGDGTLHTSAMTALTAALGVAIAWFFGARRLGG